MKIVFIGAGRLATNLGNALAAVGHDILQVYSRTMESATAMSSLCGGRPLTAISEVTAGADVYIISVSDSVIAELIPELCAGRESGIFLHTAGSIPMDIFRGPARHYGVLYPMQTFSKDRLVDFTDIPCFIEASDDSTASVVRELAGSLSRRVISLTSADRRYIHLAAVFACNFVNHCYALSDDILASRGIPFDVMLPLIDETAGKVHHIRPAAAQTGPAMRYDENVIRAQSGMLTDGSMAMEVYELMSRSIHEKALKQ